MNDDVVLTSSRENSSSPPPKCAICLGTCTNKCYSDTCFHQFCFTCLLEWSKIKPECPLCKQTFKSIIHNIKSNSEYDEYIVETTEREIIDDSFLYLPPAPSRHFQFRTTFTVDPDGELAIQQMLLARPSNSSISYHPQNNYVLQRQSRFGRLRHIRRASSATSFRRSIYFLNMWVSPTPDITGRYRDITPHYFRENPAARNRLVPWLNRELNALLRENTQHVMHLVDVIMEYLPRWHVKSRSFRQLLRPYLTHKTSHFIHEFYNFMRSPFDMIGYDRNIIYSERPNSPAFSISDCDDDSDVAIVTALENDSFQEPPLEVIEITSDSSHDSDLIIPPTPPEVVLIDSDSDSANVAGNTSNNTNEENEVVRKTILPLKIRLKRKRQLREKKSKRRCTSKYYTIDDSSSSSSSDNTESSSENSSANSTDSSTESDRSMHRHHKRKYRYKYKNSTRNHRNGKSHHKEKYKKHVTSISDTDDDSSKKNNAFDSDDNLPLSKMMDRNYTNTSTKNASTSYRTSSNSHTITSSSLNNEEQSRPSCSRWKFKNVSSTPEASCSKVKLFDTNKVYDEYPLVYPNSQYKCDHFNSYANNAHASSLPQFENISHNTIFPQYPKYEMTVANPCTSSINSYYNGDYRTARNSESYTPPLKRTTSVENTNPCNNILYHNVSSSCVNDKQIFSQCNNELSKVNVNGTSVIRNEGLEFGFKLFSAPNSSSNLVFKREKKENPNLFLQKLETSDSDEN